MNGGDWPEAPAGAMPPGGQSELLILPRYDRRGASSRLRMLQYIPYLQEAGFRVEVSPFFDEDYLARVYEGRKLTKHTGRYYARRLRDLRRRGRPHMTWLEKELYPWLPWPLEARSLHHGVPLVTDYDDAVFHRYDRHRLGAVRSLLGTKIDRVMARSDLVFAGNPYLADRARSAGARRVEIVPTVLDVRAYQPVRRRPPGTLPAIGWIGIPLNWAEHVGPLVPLFTSIVREHGAVFRAIGATGDTRPGFEYVPWDEASEVAAIQALDIGIMPLRDTPFARGKCGYKLLQYMACGLPVVASPVGVNRDIVEDGRNGFLARTEQEWREAILRLLGDPDLRARMGAEGRRKVVEDYSIQRHGPRVARLFTELADAARQDRPG